MIADFMALAHGPQQDLGVFHDIPAYDKKSRVDVVLGEDVEQFRRQFLARPIVESHCDKPSVQVHCAVADRGRLDSLRHRNGGACGWRRGERLRGQRPREPEDNRAGSANQMAPENKRQFHRVLVGLYLADQQVNARDRPSWMKVQRRRDGNENLPKRPIDWQSSCSNETCRRAILPFSGAVTVAPSGLWNGDSFSEDHENSFD